MLRSLLPLAVAGQQTSINVVPNHLQNLMILDEPKCPVGGSALLPAPALLLEPSAGKFLDLGGSTTSSIRVSLNSKFINAYQQVDVAVFSVFWVESAVDPNMKSVIVVNGKAPEDDYFLKHIPAGEHIVHARVLRGEAPHEALHHAALAGFETLSMASANVFMKQFRTFPATFNWQKVYPWQRLDTGLEVTMDLATDPFSKGVHARVPDPWPLLLSIRSTTYPKFLLARVNVRRGWGSKDILKAVGEYFNEPRLETEWILYDEAARQELEVCTGNGCSTRDQMELFNRRGSLVLMDAPTFSDTNSNALPAPSPGISHGSLDDYKAPMLVTSEDQPQQIEKKRKRRRALPGSKKK